MELSPQRSALREAGPTTGLATSLANNAGRVPDRLRPIPGLKTMAPTHPLLSDVVDRIADWDVSDGDVARTLVTKASPSTTPYFIVQYRTPFGSERQFGSRGYRHPHYVHVATVVRTGVAVIRPNGPLGVLMVRLKPEAAASLMGERMEDFLNQKIALSGLFKAGELSLLEEALMEAPDSATRFAAIESFLLRNLREATPLPMVGRAAQCLRRNPGLSIGRLAAQLDVSERHLSRAFRTMYAAGPKEFARFARLEKVVAMRHGGSAWADIAYACGFADQAHMIRDFEAVFGESPQQFFCANAPYRGDNATADEMRIARPTGRLIRECFN
jgi:AraC-like DNA-binding protein